MMESENSKINIYCDESCHLEHDHKKAMALGLIYCPKDKVANINKDIREIKKKHGIHPFWEIKWTSVSPQKINFYLELVEYFFKESSLHFRVLIVPDKNKLDHARYKQTHDDWYYKMYFGLLKVIISPKERYDIFVDYKDTRGSIKLKKLQDVLCNNLLDFDKNIIEKIQLVHSHEIEIMGLVDLLMGAVNRINNGIADPSSPAKLKIIQRIKALSQYSLIRSTLLKENKFNIFIWESGNDSK